MADDDAQLLASLANHPGWTVLRQRTKAARDSYFTSLGRQLYNNPAAVTDADIHYRRGFYRGCFWVLNNPVFTAAKLERASQDERTEDEPE